MGSPPKPWERNGAVPLPSSAAPTLVAPSNPSATTTSLPTLPDRPATFGTTPGPLSTALTTSPYGTSPYSRFGGGYGSTFGGGYGAAYGGYGMSPYSSMGMGMGMSPYGSMGYGMTPGPMNPLGMQVDANGMPIQSLTQTLEATTQHTFALLHSIVQTFSGVAQMLESTFMATHSSFFAMVGVIDQFGHLRNALGSVLGLFGLMRWMRELITGTPSSNPRMQSEFRDFLNGRPVQSAAPFAGAPKPSKKPLVIFLLAMVGIPYAMTKLVHILNERALTNPNPNPNLLPPLDPSLLTFARALYPFTPSTASELALHENDIVAITGKLDPRTGGEVDPRLQLENDEWWRGRTRDGREGWFPRKWVQVLEKKVVAAEKKVN
ncbi:SH3 domain-containing protein [Mycena kentingensis (nom. inval.)]|nr:SH3 domain-containing protein [Mycena kentingensis (nom. inval.)]